MGNSASRKISHQTGDKDQNQLIQNPYTVQEHSSGFHILELHVPSAGFTLAVVIFMLLIAAYLYKRWNANGQQPRVRRAQMQQMDVRYQHHPTHPMGLAIPPAEFLSRIEADREDQIGILHQRVRELRNIERDLLNRDSPRFQEIPTEDAGPVSNAEVLREMRQ